MNIRTIKEYQKYISPASFSIILFLLLSSSSQISLGDPLVIEKDKVTVSVDLDVTENLKVTKGLVVNENINVKGAVNASQIIGPGTVPIGTIIDWWRPTSNTQIPEGWRIADGGECTGCHSSLEGKTVPNLTNKFSRGATVSSVGSKGYTEGGNDNHYHTHNSFTTPSGGSHNHAWLYVGKDGKVKSYNQGGTSTQMIEWGNGMDADGSGIYMPAWSGKPTNTTWWYTNKTGHTHTFTLGNTKSASNVPKYVGLIKLIRVL